MVKPMAVIERYWEEIHKIPALTEEQERELALRIKQGEEKAVDTLVTSNLKYVVAMARQMSKQTEVSMDDLISEGNIAMLMAARRWDPEKEPRFVSYAQHSVRKAMEKVNGNANLNPNLNLISTDAPFHPGQRESYGDRLKAGKPMTDDGAEQSDDNYAITRAMRLLNEREQQVMQHYYGIGTTEQMTMAEIGEQMNLKRERIRQIRKTAERKMRRLMKNLLVIMMAMLCLGIQAKSKKAAPQEDKALKTVPQMYAFAVATSPLDSVVYMTDVLILKGAQVTKKTKFLMGRQDLSSQFRNHLTDIGQPDRTCATMFDFNHRKAFKKYDKLKQSLEKQGYDVRVIDQTEFQFIVTH